MKAKIKKGSIALNGKTYEKGDIGEFTKEFIEKRPTKFEIIETKVELKTDEKDSNFVKEAINEEEPVETKTKITKAYLSGMTKQMIDDLALEYGIELDRRELKETMINKFLKELNQD